MRISTWLCPWVAMLAGLLMALPATGAVGTIDGSEEGLFDEGGCSVVVAICKNVTRADGGGYFATLHLIATMTGRLDAGVTGSIRVFFEAGVGHSSIANPPEEGALILAVVRLNIEFASEPKLRNTVVPHACSFMPDGAALVPIKSLSDTRVAKTLEHIREARRPKKTPAEKP